ncbi:hypothetical protein HDV05_007640 [Chytridiales sp. JEL 0842]|nr:hypothetical protein HDV05_007640 [Chytridiales sp. JEL 0842]
MANTTADFLEILLAETHVDLDKLRSAARHGIPDEAKYDEYKSFERDNNEVMKRVRGEVTRYHRARSKIFKTKAGGADPSAVLENVISAYLSHNRAVEYSPEMVHLCGPFVYLLAQESDIYYSFASLLQKADDYFSIAGMNARLSDFLMLFRALIPDLYNHFEEEEVDFKDCATSWFQYLLSKELPMDSILSSQKDNLEELEQSEIHAVLLRLPALDMEKIINQALTIRDEVLERSLSELAEAEQ